ncbi:hypothetical protein EON83_27710 [bacterium]|nr:MAG: hypothetical protein EON83_27710 [bacterium]
MLLTNGFYGAGDTVLQLAREATDNPAPTVNTPPNPMFPASFSRPRLVQSVDNEDDAGTRGVYGIGSHRPQAVIPGGKQLRQGIGWAIPYGAEIDPLLALCVPGAGETLPSACFLFGARVMVGSAEHGTLKAQRFAKCDSVEITLSSYQEAEAKAWFWFIADEPLGTLPSGAQTAPITPSMNLAPFTWGDVKEINVRGVNVRNLVDRVSIRADYGLTRSLYRGQIPDSPWSGTTFMLQEGQFSFRSVLQFQTPDPLAYIAANGENNSARTLEIKLENTRAQIESGAAPAKLTIWGEKGGRGVVGKGVTSASPHVSRLSLVLMGLDFAAT